jgi:hypothetical protein
LNGAWIAYARPKTGIPRRCPLWPETVTALREAIARRPEPLYVEAAGLVFVTGMGRPWLSRGIANPVSFAARHLMMLAGVHHKGVGFYTLRHVFRTVADAARDPAAIDLIMGHTMGGRYRERIEDGRLRAVVDHVRHWLFGGAADGPSGGTVPETCNPSDPSDPAEKRAGSQGPQGAQENALILRAATPPVLRLYVG